MDIDTKDFTFKECKIDIKGVHEDDDGRIKFEGFASTFGNRDSDDDIIEQGAFKASLKKRKPRLLLQHRSDKPIGKFTELKENDVGLFVKGILANTKDGQDTGELLRMGALDSMSIGFIPKLTEFGKNGLRRLKEVDLFEISIVTFPANNRAAITDVKSIDAIKTIRDFEKFLREVGFSQKQAKLYASKGFIPAQDVQRDADMSQIADLINNNINILKQLKR